MSVELDDHEIKNICKDSSRTYVPIRFVMRLGNRRHRKDQWKEDGSFSCSGPNIVDTSTAEDMQRTKVYADLSRQVPKNANQLDTRIIISRVNNDGVKRGGWMAK